jgi:hypothetical protein
MKEVASLIINALLKEGSVKFMLVLAIVSLICIMLLPNFGNTFNQFDFLGAASGIAIAAFLFSSVWLLITFLIWALKQAVEIREIKGYVKNFSLAEKSFLRPYIEGKADSFYFYGSSNDLILRTLINKKIVIEIPSNSPHTQTSYRINPKYRKLIGLSDLE